jgi:hypothetical protein
MSHTATLIAQLRVVAHLTRAESQAVRLRAAQARGDDIRDALRGIAADADERARRVDGVLRDLGALPDPVAPVLGQVAALVRAAVEQTQPLDETVLADLALEHQLRDRARYLAELADAVDLPAVRTLAEDLDAAHTRTAAWLGRVLADLAAGGATLEASPLQRVAAQVTQAANAPAPRRPASTVRAGAPRGGGPTAAADPAPTGTPETGGPETETVPARAELPIPGFSALSARAAIAALRTLDDPRDVDVVLAVEQATTGRPGVVAAARARAEAVRPR